MTFLNNSKKTRFKLAVSLTVFLSGVMVYALCKDNTDFAGQCLAAIMVIAPAYILGDSFRSSTK